MRFQDIQKMAKCMDINTYRMKKTDMIRAIQRAENNIPCYGTERIHGCHEETCLWRNDCLASNNNMPAQ
ncbi:MAG: SAP domain-containing protein [Deltaproteobacteria bacterium]|nr:SAP domain-containing protein [Deltaproteobacteria bacterium]